MNINQFKAFAKSVFLFTVIFIINVSAASVQSDKEIYDFEETVLIYGSEFLPGQEVAIQINNPDNIYVLVNQTSPDQEGNFTTHYLIPEKDIVIEGNYTIYISSQSASAQTTFTLSGKDTDQPTFSNPQTNETKAGKPCKFTITWDDKLLHPYGQYIFSTNNLGTWINATLINFTSTPETITNVTTLNSTEGLVQWKYYASDNSNNWATSDTYDVTVVTTVPCELNSVNISEQCSDGSYSECEPGDTILVNATYSGDCPNPAYVQVNATGTNCSICDQDRDVCGDYICNITGITVTCEDSPCSEEWTVPNVPPECQNKTIDATHSSLNSNFPCREDSEMKDEVIPTGSFTFYSVTTTSTTTSTTASTTTVVTTSPTTTVSYTTTYSGDEFTTTIPLETESGSSTYWIIVIIAVVAGVGLFIWFKFFRSAGGKEEQAFERLKRKWTR
jgi:hypothetical protein